ncbi:unnamed protein product, partial [Thelazia callipaeda]|uniref:BUD13 homolog n=1 Tax=Thelazia callipaeda TaxID=103827 RepID=A0A0N5CZP5_THECL
MHMRECAAVTKDDSLLTAKQKLQGSSLLRDHIGIRNKNINNVELNEQYKDARLTSGALRRRNHESSIVFGTDYDNNRMLRKKETENVVSFQRQSKEYEDSYNGDPKMLLKIREGRNHSAETRDNIGLILQPKEGRLLGQSAAHHDYGQKERERHHMHRKADITDSDKETQTKAEFTPKHGERYETVRPRTSDFWKKEGKIEKNSVAHMDYLAWKGERYPVIKPKDSNILTTFDGGNSFETQKMVDFKAWKGGRSKMARPEPSDIWKREGKMESKTVTQKDFMEVKSEQYPIRKPQDSRILSDNAKYVAKTSIIVHDMAKINQRCDVTRTNDSELWNRSCKLEGQSVTQKDYIAAENKGRNAENKDQHFHYKNSKSFKETMKNPELQEEKKQNQKLKPPIYANEQKDRQQKEDERKKASYKDYNGSREKCWMISNEQDSDIPHENNSLTSETLIGKEYTKKKGNRFEAIRPGDSDIWK